METFAIYHEFNDHFWSLSKIKYFGIINSAKGKHPTPFQFYLFSFPTLNETKLVYALKYCAKSILY